MNLKISTETYTGLQCNEIEKSVKEIEKKPENTNGSTPLVLPPDWNKREKRNKKERNRTPELEGENMKKRENHGRGRTRAARRTKYSKVWQTNLKEIMAEEAEDSQVNNRSSQTPWIHPTILLIIYKRTKTGNLK